jgi:predicted nucleic acid-binding Zn ribbon protein
LEDSRYKDGKSMKDSVQGFLEALGIDAKMHEVSVLSKWEEIMGSAVAKRTEKKYIKNRVLYLELNSSVMRGELMQQRSEIVKKINAVSGVPIIDEVHLA